MPERVLKKRKAQEAIAAAKAAKMVEDKKASRIERKSIMDKAAKYAAEYKRVFELADRYGNAAVVIRGHSDTTLVLRDAVKAGLENGRLQRSGQRGSRQSQRFG